MSKANESLVEVLNQLFSRRTNGILKVDLTTQKSFWALQWFYPNLPEIPKEFQQEIPRMFVEVLAILKQLDKGSKLEPFPVLSEQLREYMSLNRDISDQVTVRDNKLVGMTISIFEKAHPDVNKTSLLRHFIRNGQDVYADILLGQRRYSFEEVADSFTAFAVSP